MLVLSRRENERIHIGNGIAVTVLGVKGGVVKLGIDAPKDVLISRDDVVAADEELAAYHGVGNQDAA